MEYQSTSWLARLATLLGGSGQPIGVNAWLAHIYTLLGNYINYANRTLKQSSVSVVAPANDTNENILATYTIPAGTIQAGDEIEIMLGGSHTNSANTKTWRVRLGGVAGTVFAAYAVTTSAAIQSLIVIRFPTTATEKAWNSGNSSPFGTGSGAFTTGAIDMANAQDLVITGQKATGSETMTLESYSMRLRKAPAA